MPFGQTQPPLLVEGRPGELAPWLLPYEMHLGSSASWTCENHMVVGAHCV